MKKIDMKKTLNERVRNTEWTEENTWNVLRKIRNAKSVRREFSLRRLMPAAVALVLVLGIGVAALTGNPGGPDPIRDKDTYTAQPLVTALSAGQGEGTGDLPEGNIEKNVIEALREHFPEVADQLMPVNRSCEKDGLRLDLISGLVKGDETWVVYSLQDLEKKYPGATVKSMLWDNNIGTPDGGEDQVLFTDEKEHKYYFCSHNHYTAPISTEARMITLGVSHYEAYRMEKLDALQLLDEYGITSEGVLSPERLPGVNADGTPLIQEKVKVLDYNQPHLNIPVIGDVVLTGIGWVDGAFHVQFHNPNSRSITTESITATSNWDVYPDWEGDYWKEGLIDYVVWDENGDESMDWSEIVLHCDREYLAKMEPQLKVSIDDGIETGDWVIDLPLNLICAESEPVEVETKSPVLDADIAYDISEFFRDWAAGDAELMWGDVTMEWRLSREDGDGSIRSLIASGTPRRYQINDITDGASDGGKIITCTVEMTIPGTEEIEIRRYRVSVKPTEHGFYKVDPAGFIDWEDGEYDPAMEMVLVDQTTVLNKLQSDGYSDTTKYLKPMNLICEKQGIRLNVMSGGIRDQEGWFVCAVEDMEGAYADFPIDPVFSGNFGAEAEVTSTRMYRNALEHYTVYMVYVNYKQPVTPEACTVTLNMDSVMVHEGAQADLVPLLQEHAKTVEGVELPQLATIILRNRDRGATEVPGLKVLDYTQPLNIPLFNHTYLANAGWIDGKLHVQICHTNRTPDSYDALWINTLLDGKMDILRKEADYSPVDWYDDKAYWYEYIFDYTPEDIEQLEMTAAFLDGRKELKDDWTVSFPLSMIRAEDKPAAAETAELSQAEGENMRQYYARIKDEMHPVGLSLEKQGIRVEIESALVHGDESLIQYSIQDLEGKYKDLYMDLDGYDFINTICANDEQVYGLINRFNLGVSILNLGEDKNTHKHGFLRQTKHTEPVQPEDREVTLGLKDIRFMWRTVKELNEYLKEYAKTEEGVFDSYYIPTQETIKILGQENRLEIPLERDDVLLTGIGWIDGKLHVRVEYTGEKDPVKIAINDRVCQVGNNSIYSDTREPIRELDYSPVLFRDDSTGMVTGYEMVLDCSPEDVEKISLEVNIRVLEKVLEDDWTFQVPLSMICPEVEPAAEEPKAQTGELLNESYNIDGTEVQLHAVDRNFEKQGMRVNVIGGLVKGNEFWVKYSVQDLENKYSGLEMFPEAYINTVCPEDGMSTGEVVPERAVVITSSLDTDKVSHTSTFLTQFIHSQTIQDKGQEITFGLKDLKFTRHTTVDLHKYVEEYAKPEEGELSRTYNGQKILNTSEKLNIPMGRDDVLLTGIGWIDNQLHARFEYTDEGDFLKNGKSYGQACNVWISGEYLDSAKKQESGVAYTMLTGSDKAGATPNRFEEILECGPDNYNEVSLRAHIEVIEDAVQDDWAVSFPLNTIYEGNEPAETAAAEEEELRRNDPAREEIYNCLNEFYYCWMNNDKEGMQARGVPGEDDRDYKSLMDTLLDLGLPQAFYPGEIRETGAENTRSLHGSASFRTPEGEDVAYYVDFVVEKADDGQWYVRPEITWSPMHVVELQETTEDGQDARKLAWPITVSMELSADRLAGPAPVNVDISVTNTSGRKLEESVRLFDQTMTQIEAFGASGLDAGETRTWSGEYTVTREQLAEGKVLFFLYFSEYNESTEEFEDHLVSFYRPITKEEPPMPYNSSSKPITKE